MDSEKLNSRLAILANFGVVVGLFLLAYELRQAQHFAETEAAVRRLNQMQEAQAAMAMSESLPEIRVRALSDGIHTLTPEELYRLQRWENSVRLRMRSQYIQYTRGYLDEEMASDIVKAAVYWLPYWEEVGYELGDDEFELAIRRAAGR
jgi:hypothetical protein